MTTTNATNRPRNVYRMVDGMWRRVMYESLGQVRDDADKNYQAWHVIGAVLIVSEADGTIHRYTDAAWNEYPSVGPNGERHHG